MAAPRKASLPAKLLAAPPGRLQGEPGAHFRRAPPPPAPSDKQRILDWAPAPGSGPPPHYGTASPPPAGHASVADIIGDFGLFQFLVLLFSGLREGSVGYDAVVTSIVLQPEKSFFCADHAGPPGRPFNATEQCFRWRADGSPRLDPQSGRQLACGSWRFPHAPRSLVAEWALVCDRHWLVAFVESAYFLGLVLGNLAWGYYADRAGRRRAYLLSHWVALLGGLASLAAPSMELFAACRFVSAFGAIGYNIIYSIQVELIGTKYRAFCTCLNHLGWGAGVLLIPYANAAFDHYRYKLALAPALALVMFPLAFWLPESARWLMAADQFAPAKRELLRAARFNGKSPDSAMHKRISLLMDKIGRDKLSQQLGQAGAPRSAYRLIFSNHCLARDTLILALATFLGHLFYYMLTISFAYMENLSLEANFITSGAGEWVSVLLGAFLLKKLARKTCMSLFLLVMGASFLLQALVDSRALPQLDTPLVVGLVNGAGTLSSLLLIFVVLIVNQEVFPTVIRQTGSSVINTLGESGSTMAPVLVQVSRMLGLWQTDLVYVAACVSGAVAVQFVTKTDDIELSDTLLDH